MNFGIIFLSKLDFFHLTVLEIPGSIFLWLFFLTSNNHYLCLLLTCIVLGTGDTEQFRPNPCPQEAHRTEGKNVNVISAVGQDWKGCNTKEGLLYLLGEGAEKKIASGHLCFTTGLGKWLTHELSGLSKVLGDRAKPRKEASDARASSLSITPCGLQSIQPTRYV